MANEGFVVDGSITVAGVNIDLTGTTVGSTLLRTDGSFSAAQETPVGTVVMYGGSIGAGPSYSGLPSGWLLCDGTEYDSTGTYSGLYAVIGNRYNTGGETSGYFRVPNLVDRIPVGHTQSENNSVSTISSSSAGDANHQHTYTYTSGNQSGYAPSSHTHPSITSSGAHNHGATDAGSENNGNKGSHTHGPTDFNNGSHSHVYDFGNTAAVSGGTTDNHTHDLPSTTANHGHNQAGDANAQHSHNVSNADLSAHSHEVTISNFAANQSSTSHSHTGGLSTVGFFFIIKV